MPTCRYRCFLLVLTSFYIKFQSKQTRKQYLQQTIFVRILQWFLYIYFLNTTQSLYRIVSCLMYTIFLLIYYVTINDIFPLSFIMKAKKRSQKVNIKCKRFVFGNSLPIFQLIMDGSMILIADLYTTKYMQFFSQISISISLKQHF